MKVYTLSGLDGSGKSTHAKKIAEHLRNQGKKVFEFHIITFAFSQVLSRFYKKIFSSPKKNLETDTQNKGQKSVIRSSRLGLCLRKIFLLIDMLRWQYLKKKLAREGYDAIVSDRFFYDTLINIFYLEKSLSAQSILEVFAPQADQAVYLCAEVEDIMQHDRVPDQGEAYLISKKDLYDRKYSEWNLKRVAVAQSKDETFEALKKSLEII